MALFEIGATSGELTFKSAPNFEDPQDSGTDNIHEVTVRATSGAGTRAMTADQTITVTVTNADEGQSGTVSIDDTTPMVGDELTASTANAADPDGLPDPFAPTWKWYRTPDGGSETEITGETSATYTVVAADLGATLAAKASWTDTGGFANTLASAPTSAVAAASALPTLSVGNASGTEGLNGFLFPLTLSAGASQNVTVTCTASFESGDTAVAADLSTTTGTATIQARVTTGTCAMATVSDTLDEEDETFTVTLSNPSSNAQLAADPTATGTIVDDDPPVLSFKQASYTAAEGGSAVEVELTLTSALPDNLSVTMTAEHGAGATAEDYTGIRDGARAFFSAGQTRSVFEVTASDDAFDEADETVTFGFTIPSSADVTEGSVSEATLTLTDNDDPPTVTVGDAEATEGGKVEFEVTLSAVSGRDVTVDYATSVGTGQTATSGTDFTAADGTLTIPAADATDTGTIEVQTTQDTTEEDDETFTLTISNPTNATLGTKTAATGMIEDDDGTVTNNAPAFSSDDAFDAAENQTAVGTVVAADSDADDSVTGYAITGGADMALFEIGATTGVLTFKSAPNYEDPQDSGTDNIHEVTVRGTSGAGTRVMTTDQTITVTVTDVSGEAPGKPDAPMVSAASATSLTVNWSAPSNAGPAITDYDVQYREGTSGGWTDGNYTGTATTATLTGLSENTSHQVQVRATNDEGTGAWSDAGSGTTDANAAPAPEAPQAEAGSYTSLVVSWTAPDTGDGAAITGYEIRYREHPGGEWESWPHDGTGAAATITGLEVNTAYEVEVRALYGEMQSVWVRVPGQVRTNAPPAAPVIERIEVVSTPRLWSRGAREPDTYGEGENIRIEARFDQPVRVEGYPVLALEVGDPCISVCEARYESGSGTDTLVFAYLVLDTEIDPNGVAIPANPIGESIDDFDGFSIRNEAGQEARLSYRRKGTQSGHKVDGTRQAGQYFSVEDAEAHEADGEMAFTVRLEPRGLGIVTIDYETREDSGNEAAVAGLDYTETRGTLRFNPLEAERTVTVPIIDDDEEDDGETFTLRLSNPDGAVLRDADKEATGTIRNSDPAALSASIPASAFASASHSGAEDRPQAVVTFSEAVAEFAADTPSVSVTGGAVASVRPHAEDGLEHAWVFFLAPDGDGAVTFALVADAACAAAGICTAGGKALTEVPAAATIPGPGETEEPEGPPLTAEFEDMPERHDGESAFTFRIAFSERVGWMNGRRLREDVVAVAGGRATAAGRVDRRRDLWEVTVEPDSEADVTVTLEAGAACGTPAAVCTSDGRALSETISATMAGPDGTAENAPAQGAPTIAGEARVGETLTASTSGIADADGLDNVEFAYRWLRGGADIPGATGRTYTAADADEGGRLKVRVGFEDDAGHAESLTSAATGPVEAVPRANMPAQGRPEIRGKARVGETLTASTSGITDADGLDNATFAYRWLRDGADIPGATGATYTAAEADEGERLKVRVTFTDDAGNEESLTSASTKRVAARSLPKVSVADARVLEAAGATLDFAVTLSAPPPGPVTVDYRTLDASAKAGEDYEARAGTLAFAAGETAKTLRVTVLDDDVDEGDETMVVVLDPGPGVGRGDRLASGTIENSDPLPEAWLVRFGRTASDHAVEAIEARFGDPGGASHATFGGRRLWGGGGLFDAPARGLPGDPFACGPFVTAPDGGTGPDGAGRTFGANAGTGSGTNAETDCGTSGGTNAGVNGAMGAGVHGGMNAGLNAGLSGGMGTGMNGGMDGARRGPSTGGGHRPRLRDLLLGSAFRLSAGGGDDTGAPRRLTAWGGASATRFDGVADGVSVNGETATFLVGADASWNRWLAGITVAHSIGAGGFRGGPGGGAGELDSTLTAVHPYARWQANDRLSAWGVLGYGAGDLTLETNGAAWETDTSMRMAAGGLRGVFLRGAGGLELAAKTDLRVTRIASDGVEDNTAGLLAAAAGGTSRLRLLVEGSRSFRFGATRMLTPTLELGVRHDGGDAETGAGIDLGGSLRYADAALGLTAEASGRYLVAHGDDAYREWGASASVRIDPGTPGRGLTLSVTPSWGASATGGAGRLWSVRDARGLGGRGFDAAMRLRAEVGYGLAAFRGKGAVTPFAGLSMAGSMGRDWRFGAQWTRGAALGCRWRPPGASRPRRRRRTASRSG